MVNLKRHRHYFLWWYLLPVFVQAGQQKLKAMAVGPSRSRDGHQGRGQPWSGHEGPQGQAKAKARLGCHIGQPGSGLARPSAAVLQHSSDKDHRWESSPQARRGPRGDFSQLSQPPDSRLHSHAMARSPGGQTPRMEGDANGLQQHLPGRPSSLVGDASSLKHPGE